MVRYVLRSITLARGGAGARGWEASKRLLHWMSTEAKPWS